jgi:hypothetical protein
MSNKAAQNMFLEAQKRANEEARKPENEAPRGITPEPKQVKKVTQNSTYKSTL